LPLPKRRVVSRMSERTVTQQVKVVCPLCTKEHVYDARVTFSDVSYFMRPPPKSFTRLFVCPETGRTFQATIQMRAQTRDVAISGLHEQGEADSEDEGL
jgi:hypothetical protein